MASLETSLDVSFSTDEGEKPLNLEFERFIPEIGNPAGKAILRLYPAVKAELFASRGWVQAGGTRYEDIKIELVTFNKSSTANTQHIMKYAPSITKNWTFDINTGRKVWGVKFTGKAGTNVITCNQAITGVVFVTYKAEYKELIFTMAIEYTGRTSRYSYTGNMIFHKGTVLAYYDGVVAQVEVTPPTLTSPTAETSKELYRVVSYVVVTEDGAWESPDDWPEKNVYASKPGVEGPEIGSSFIEHERVHEVGIVDDFGRFSYVRYVTPDRQPFATDETYKPVYDFEFSYSKTDITDPMCAINADSITNRLKGDYGFSSETLKVLYC